MSAAWSMPAPTEPPDVLGMSGGLFTAPRPQRSRSGRGWRIGGFVVVVIAAIGATAAISCAIGQSNSVPPSNARVTTAAPAVPAPQFSQADVAAAKQHICGVFDDSTIGQAGEGGFRTNAGAVNMPLAMRVVNSVVAVENALAPATPPDVLAAAKKYIDTNLAVTTAALGTSPTDELNRLGDTANDATYAFADVCGLKR
jgi:hypothetical protein